MAFGLVRASYSLPERQAVELTFFAPLGTYVNLHVNLARTMIDHKE